MNETTDGREPRVALVTCAALPELSPDCQRLIPALNAVGVAVEIVAWDAGPAPSCPLLIRSTWNYYRAREAFLDWIGDREVLNPREVLWWNADKRYLMELADAGVGIVPTQVVASTVEARDVAASLGWNEVVIKPSVSANAWLTSRTFGEAVAVPDEQIDGVWLLQPYVPQIEQGELSLIFFDGGYSHCVRKVPRSGDFRVQNDHGGSVQAEDPAPEVVDMAERVIAAIPHSGVAYARVDGVLVKGELQVMEVELIEPELFFRVSADAAPRFANVVKSWLVRGEGEGNEE